METDHTSELRDPTFQAFALLRTVFTVAPILFGLDKFFDILTDWNKYLAPWINNIVPGNATTAMEIVGVIEVAAGILVAVAPRIGAYVVALWLLGIIVNLLTLPGFYDVALRDFGLMVAALALGRLAQARAVTTRESRSTVGAR
jgi:phage-related protein